MSTPTILVTGSSGHLGAALVLSLPSYGFQPLGIDILPSPTTHHICDITSPAQVAALFASNPDIAHIIHSATLHKPHVASHPKSAFINTNISGTLHLLEAATALPTPPQSFVFISTTSSFGSALSPAPGSPAAWIDEHVVPRPKNIYGATKIAAEDICYLLHKQTKLPILVLRTSRFFPEADDDEDRRSAMDDENLKVCELAYRRVDIADVVSACVRATSKAAEIGWGRYIISAPPPVRRDGGTLQRLDADAAGVIKDTVPGVEEVFGQRGWKFLDRIDRVYDSSKALRELGWKPEYTFEKTVERLRAGEEWRSQLTFKVGKKGYHAVSTGVYTVR